MKMAHDLDCGPLEKLNVCYLLHSTPEPPMSLQAQQQHMCVQDTVMVRVGIEWPIYTKLPNKSSNPIEIIGLGACTIFLWSSCSSSILTDACSHGPHARDGRLPHLWFLLWKLDFGRFLDSIDSPSDASDRKVSSCGGLRYGLQRGD